MSRNVRRHSHHRAPRCRWLLPFSKVAPSDRGAVLAVPPGAARALGGSPGGGRGRVRPRCALEGVPAGRARNKGQERMYAPAINKELSVGTWSPLAACSPRADQTRATWRSATGQSLYFLPRQRSAASATTCGQRAAPMQQPPSPSRCRSKSPRVLSARNSTAICNRRLLLFPPCSSQLRHAHIAQLQAKGVRQQSSYEALCSRGGGVGSPQAEVSS